GAPERSPLQPGLDLQKADPLTSPTTYGSMGHSPSVATGSGTRRPPSFVLPDPMQPIHQRRELGLAQLDGSDEHAIDDEELTIPPATISRTGTIKTIEEGGRPFLKRVLTLGRQPATVSTEL